MDPAERSQALHDAEDVLMKEVGCIPLAFYNDFWLQSEKITGSWQTIPQHLVQDQCPVLPMPAVSIQVLLCDNLHHWL